MDESTGVPADDQAIGRRARSIRTRRGLSLDTAAGLAGISKPHLSRLETGQRRFIRRGLLEDLANALGCSVADLTGQPYLFPDRQSASAASCVPALVQRRISPSGVDAVAAAPGASGSACLAGRRRP